jgi:aspartyl-tRNA(Asn)/glutamyl-tRNA(Gln) amidotransferase subunit C
MWTPGRVGGKLGFVFKRSFSRLIGALGASIPPDTLRPRGAAGKRGAIILRRTPMSIDIDTARKVAKLARIRVDEAHLPKLAEQLSGILGFMEQLNEVNVEGIEPMVSVTPMRLARRADVVTDGNIQAQILKNAPDAREGFFAVPKVVE